MTTSEQQRFKNYLIRDKEWLESLYTATNSAQAQRLLNFASDTKLDTLIKYLHYLSNGAIKIKRANFEAIPNHHLRWIKKHFETKVGLTRGLQLAREEKLKRLRRLVTSFSHLLYPLFNQQ